MNTLFPFISILSLLFSLSVVIFCGEIYVCYIFDSTDSFALTKASKRWFERYYHMNSLRVRDDIEYSLNKTHDMTRITLLGDSFTVGHGIRNVEERFTNVIRNKKKGEYEIHLLAKNGFDTGAEIHMLASALAEGYSLDWVVLVYCLNDISDIDPSWNKMIRRFHIKYAREPWIIRQSFFLNFLYYRMKSLKDPDILNYYGFIKKSYESPVWETQKKRLIKLKEMVEKNRGHFAVVTFPFLHRLGEDYDYGSVHEKLDTFWKILGVPHLDLLNKYQKFSERKWTVSRYDAHPNEEAHNLAANAILEFLEGLTEKEVKRIN